MSLPRHPSAYADIEAVLDTAMRNLQVAEKGHTLRFECPTRAKAVTWRLRANTFRSVLRRLEEERLSLSPGSGTSIYDSLVFGISGMAVTIRLRQVEGHLVSGDDVLPIKAEKEMEEDDDLFD